MHECPGCRGEKTVPCVNCDGAGKRFVGFYVGECKECAGTGTVQAPFKPRHNQTEVQLCGAADPQGRRHRGAMRGARQFPSNAVTLQRHHVRGPRSASLTADEARRIAMNIARLPALLGSGERQQS
jgi:hypothetical protein